MATSPEDMRALASGLRRAARESQDIRLRQTMVEIASELEQEAGFPIPGQNHQPMMAD